MRLIHSTNFELHEFIGSQIPQYAILSHTWGEEEISFQELQRNVPEVKEKKGFDKIRQCCRVAAEDGFEYAWVDTCCIDKTSSAELSEAINSMFRWYQRAEVCYAFLADVPSDEDPQKEGSAFRKSRWFTRGWTLQELIAPAHVTFPGKGRKRLCGFRRKLSKIHRTRASSRGGTITKIYASSTSIIVGF
ncbi:HET domain containing protein [Hyaloscypha variabilis]